MCCCAVNAAFLLLQDKLYQEVNEVVGNSKITVGDIPKLSYTERVLCESMRILPPIPLLGRKVKEETKLGMYFSFSFSISYLGYLCKYITYFVLGSCTLPVGARVIISITALHNDPKIWKEPQKFDPDRFLPEEVARRPGVCCYIPFSYGFRSCIGT